ncbi:unnamed protein product [Heterobilharzia americana]|nr:unnamed protein product [Heterobilharzia americana]
MCSNVELQKSVIDRVADDSGVDVHTGRLRHGDYHRLPTYSERSLFKQPEHGIFFSHDRCTKSSDGVDLCGNSPDIQYVDEFRSKYPVTKYNGSRPGAFFPWPRNMAGERVVEYNRSLPLNNMIGIEMERRPSTNLPGEIKMAFGRAAPGYYAQKYPNKETWFNSNVLHNRVSIPRFGSPSRTQEDYRVCNTRLKQYLTGLNEVTEYQDKYLAHTPSIK